MDFRIIGDIFFPPACLGCGDRISIGVICSACRTDIHLYDTLFCGTCMARLPDGRKICHKDAPYRLGAAASYDDRTVSALVHGLKFRGIAAAAAPLAELIVRYIGHAGISGLAERTVIPVPLSLRRARARGFNQAALIARRLVATLDLPIEEHALMRAAHRKPQSDTESILERRGNVRGAFAPGSAMRAVKGKSLVLVDDVVTSGTTFTEAARVLKENGARNILALAAAKA